MKSLSISVLGCIPCAAQPIKGNRDKTINGNDTLTVNKNRKENINKSRSLNVDKNNTELVKMAKSVTVGLAYATQVGTIMNTAVGIMQTEQIGRIKKSFVGKSYSITAGDEFKITVGKSSLVMNADGSIIITGMSIITQAEGENKVIGKDVLINPPGGVGVMQALPEPVSNQITKTGLDDGVIGIDQFINEYAPTLSNDIKELQKSTGLFGRIKGWTLEYGVAGESSHVDTQNKSIVIDPNKKGNLDELVRSIAHEVGHAKYDTPFDKSTKQSFVTSFLRNEGAAMVSNFMVRDEILSRGGHDVGISGNTANHSQYESIYKLHGDTPEAYDQIATIFGSNEKVKDGRTYNDYYGDFYDATYSK